MATFNINKKKSNLTAYMSLNICIDLISKSIVWKVETEEVPRKINENLMGIIFFFNIDYQWNVLYCSNNRTDLSILFGIIKETFRNNISHDPFLRNNFRGRFDSTVKKVCQKMELINKSLLSVHHSLIYLIQCLWLWLF